MSDVSAGPVRSTLSVRFITILLVAGGLAFAMGVRFIAAPSPLSHPLTGRTIPGMATNAGWLDRAERAEEEAPERILDLIGIRPGMTVADVGAGTGYVTVLLSRRVGTGGRVFANELQSTMRRHIEERVTREQLANVEIVAGAPDDDRLPDATIDVALLVDVYHELRQPASMMRSIRRSLRADGTLAVVEYRKEDTRLPIAPSHRMSAAELRAEIELEGFVLERTIEELPRQHILLFRPRAAR